jgi:hypothetical protein
MWKISPVIFFWLFSITIRGTQRRRAARRELQADAYRHSAARIFRKERALTAICVLGYHPIAGEVDFPLVRHSIVADCAPVGIIVLSLVLYVVADNRPGHSGNLVVACCRLGSKSY